MDLIQLWRPRRLFWHVVIVALLRPVVIVVLLLRLVFRHEFGVLSRQSVLTQLFRLYPISFPLPATILPSLQFRFQDGDLRRHCRSSSSSSIIVVGNDRSLAVRRRHRRRRNNMQGPRPPGIGQEPYEQQQQKQQSGRTRQWKRTGGRSIRVRCCGHTALFTLLLCLLLLLLLVRCGCWRFLRTSVSVSVVVVVVVVIVVVVSSIRRGRRCRHYGSYTCRWNDRYWRWWRDIKGTTVVGSITLVVVVFVDTDSTGGGIRGWCYQRRRQQQRLGILSFGSSRRHRGSGGAACHGCRCFSSVASLFGR